MTQLRGIRGNQNPGSDLRGLAGGRRESGARERGEFGREATETDGARVSWVRCVHVARSAGASELYRRWRVSFGMAPSEPSPDGLQILSPL